MMYDGVVAVASADVDAEARNCSSVVTLDTALVRGPVLAEDAGGAMMMLEGPTRRVVPYRKHRSPLTLTPCPRLGTFPVRPRIRQQ